MERTFTNAAALGAAAMAAFVLAAAPARGEGGGAGAGAGGVDRTFPSLGDAHRVERSYSLVWQDEFTGTKLDRKRWKPEDDGKEGKAEYQFAIKYFTRQQLDCFHVSPVCDYAEVSGRQGIR